MVPCRRTQPRKRHNEAMSDEVTYDAVLFDLMGTVVYDPYLEALQAATQLDVQTMFSARDPQCWPDFERGAIDEAEFVRRFFPDPQPGHVFDIAAFNHARRAGYDFMIQGMGGLPGAPGRSTSRRVRPSARNGRTSASPGSVDGPVG